MSYAFWVTDGYSEKVLNDGRHEGRDSSSLTPRGSKEVRQSTLQTFVSTTANVKRAYSMLCFLYTVPVILSKKCHLKC